MNTPEILTMIRSPRMLKRLTKTEKQLAKNIMVNCFNLKKHESVLIVSDPRKRREATLFFEAAQMFSPHVTLVEMTERTQDAEEPPKAVARLMRQFDVQLLVTTKSLSHTRAREDACKRGVRIASLPGVTLEMARRTLTVNFSELAVLSKKVAGLLTAGSTATVSSKNGTKITLSLAGRSAIADTGSLSNPGDFGNLPPGEAFISPLEGNAHGVVVFDGCFADIDLDEPITVTIEHGVATEIIGGTAARRLETILSNIGKNGRNVAELGVGTNKKATLSSVGANLLEVEKVFGTVHIALGNNATIGGEVDVPFHSDGVILVPTLEIDNTVVLQEGKFLI